LPGRLPDAARNLGAWMSWSITFSTEATRLTNWACAPAVLEMRSRWLSSSGCAWREPRRPIKFSRVTGGSWRSTLRGITFPIRCSRIIKVFGPNDLCKDFDCRADVVLNIGDLHSSDCLGGRG